MMIPCTATIISANDYPSPFIPLARFLYSTETVAVTAKFVSVPGPARM